MNRELVCRFKQAGIDFAFPTQTLHLAGDGDRPLDIGIRNAVDTSIPEDPISGRADSIEPDGGDPKS